MEKFTTLSSIAAPLMRVNIDTDTIIPSREIKSVSKTGLGAGLFAGWRREDPDFVFNRPAYHAAKILLTGDNFGCGSSREHAVWALGEWGIRAIIAPSFGSIFYANCIRNGLLPVVLPKDAVTGLAEDTAEASKISIDLENQTVTAPSGAEYGFEISAGHKEMLISGIDHIELTLRSQERISAFRAEDKTRRAWAYLANPALA